MRLILFVQTYRARTTERQAEIDRCMRSNLQHPSIDQIIVLREPDAPELPGPARMPVKIIEEAERVSYARWMQLLRKEHSSVGILINADIALDTGFDKIEEVLDTPESVMALSRYNPNGDGQPPRLNRYPQWTQDTWAMRSDAPITESLLYSSAFPIGFPGCDNRIAYVYWSHGLTVKNPCYFITTIHHQADESRAYDKNGDRLYGGVSYVHPSLALEDGSELEHTIWTRSAESCSGVIVNQQAVDKGIHQLLAKDAAVANLFVQQQKSAGHTWSYPLLGCQRSAHGSGIALAELIRPDGWCLQLPRGKTIQGLQLRLPRKCKHGWELILQGKRHDQVDWIAVTAGSHTELAAGGVRTLVQAKALQESWQQLRLKLSQPDQTAAATEGLMELLVFTKEKEPPISTTKETKAETRPPEVLDRGVLKLQLSDRHLANIRTMNLDGWNDLYSYSSRFLVKQKDNALVFIDRFWPTAVVFERGGSIEWSAEALQEAFLWGFAGPVLEWKENHFSPEKVYLEQLNFWQYPCRTEQDAFERHKRFTSPYRDQRGVHIYMGLPWATWIDKKSFPEGLLDAFRNRVLAMQEVLGLPMQVHSICQHIRWKEHTSRFEQAGIDHLWIAHKEKGWDTEGRLQLYSWPLYAVNVLDPARREGIEFVPVQKKKIFASFKGAHMKHYPSDIRLRLRELSQLDGYAVEVSDLWHFNKVVYNYQVANKTEDKEAIEEEEVRAYNKLLSETLFSLCPGGSGPNTLRLWESLGIGSIPVVLSDRYEFPSLNRMGLSNMSWADAVIEIPEQDIFKINDQLIQLDQQAREQLQAQGQVIFKKSRDMSCFA